MKKFLSFKILLIPGVVIIGYLLGAYFFDSHFLPRTSIDGADVSFKSAEEAKQIMDKAAESYVLTLSERGGKSFPLTAQEIGLKPLSEKTAYKLLRQQKELYWGAAFFTQTDFHADEAEEAPEQRVKSALEQRGVFQEGTDPQDATLVFQNGSFQIVPEQEGDKLDEGKTCKAVAQAIRLMKPTLSLEEAGCYKEPKFRADSREIAEAKSRLEAIAAETLTFRFGENTENLSGQEIASWLQVGKDLEIQVNRDQAAAFVKTLARKYDTFGGNRNFKTSKGAEIVVRGGNYGWWMNRDKTTDALVDAIKKGQDAEVKPVYKLTGAQFGANDYGNSYVEVDLDAQHVYLYKNGALVAETDCVSGKPINGNATPDGTYFLNYKEKDATLKGEDYSTPVSFWMPFNGNIGMHDAYWRKEFGGKLYLARGSHGCINLPPAQAKIFFANLEKGEAVIVYGGMNQAQAQAYLADEKKKQEDEQKKAEQKQQEEEAAAAAAAAAAAQTLPSAQNPN